MPTNQRKSQNDVDTYQVREWSGEAMAAALANWVNGADQRDFDEFADKLVLAEHRTLQQCAWQVMKRCIQRWAERGDLGEGRGYDLRNQQTVTECQQVRDLFVAGHMGDMWFHTSLI